MSKQIVKCSVDGCDVPKRANGYCAVHNARMQRNGHMNIIDNRKFCQSEGCDKYTTNSYCRQHNKSNVTHDDLINLKKSNKSNICDVSYCENVVKRDGFCAKHHVNYSKYNDPTYSDKIKAKWKYIREHISYSSYEAMLWRCSPKNKTAKNNYYDRGIKVSNRWLGADGVMNFYEDMGKKPTKNHSLDRIDNDKGYYSENCRWATAKEQSDNRRLTRNVLYNDEVIPLVDICKRFNQPYDRIRFRLNKGMDIYKALSMPLKKNRFIEYNGETKTITEWSIILKSTVSTVGRWINLGWTMDEIFQYQSSKKEIDYKF